MIRSLRKGCTSVYFQHANTGHSIGAEKYECEIKDGEAIVRFSLRPIDGNQTEDEKYSRIHPLQYIEIDDSYVVEGLQRYLKHHTHEFTAWRLQVLSGGQMLSFAVSPRVSRRGTLQLVVEATDGWDSNRDGSVATKPVRSSFDS